MYKNITHSAIILSIFLAPFSTQQLEAHYRERRHSTMQFLGQAILGTVSIATTIASIYTLAKWLMTPTNEQVIEKAINSSRIAYQQYMPILSAIETAHMITINKNASYTNLHNIIASATEEQLGVTAEKLCKYNAKKIHQYLCDLSDSTYQLTTQNDTILARIHDLLVSSDNNGNIYQSMQKITSDLEHQLSQLGFLYDYLKYHAPYFALYGLEVTIKNHYQKELLTMTQLRQENGHLPRDIYAAIIARKLDTAHPGLLYHNYLYALDHNIKELKMRLSKIECTYPTIINRCTALLSQLDAIQHTIYASSEYAIARRDYDIYLQQEELLAVEQSKSAALHDQNRILREQNRLKERELREQKQSTDIIIEIECDHDDIVILDDSEEYS